MLSRILNALKCKFSISKLIDIQLTVLFFQRDALLLIPKLKNKLACKDSGKCIGHSDNDDIFDAIVVTKTNDWAKVKSQILCWLHQDTHLALVVILTKMSSLKSSIVWNFNNFLERTCRSQQLLQRRIFPWWRIL